MTIHLTAKETAMLNAFIEEGMGCNGATCREGLLEDNMTWMNADDLKDALGWNKQEVGGVMSSLDAKGMIDDSGESPRGAACTDWYASYEAIHWYFDNK